MRNSNFPMTFDQCVDFINRTQTAKNFKNIDWSAWSEKADRAELINKSFATSLVVIKSFDELYRRREWGTGSGIGSLLGATREMICHLQSLIFKYNITLFVDAPCGDQQWAPELRRVVPSLRYIGFDVVPALIQRNIEEFSVPNRAEFFLMDLMEPNGYEKLFKHSSLWREDDNIVIFSRKAWQHNTNAHVVSLLAELRRLKQYQSTHKGKIYIVATDNIILSFKGTGDIVDGGFASRNYHSAPFNLPEALESFKDSIGGNQFEVMELWSIDRF